MEQWDRARMMNCCQRCSSSIQSARKVLNVSWSFITDFTTWTAKGWGVRVQKVGFRNLAGQGGG